MKKKKILFEVEFDYLNYTILTGEGAAMETGARVTINWSHHIIYAYPTTHSDPLISSPTPIIVWLVSLINELASLLGTYGTETHEYNMSKISLSQSEPFYPIIYFYELPRASLLYLYTAHYAVELTIYRYFRTEVARGRWPLTFNILELLWFLNIFWQLVQEYWG